MEIGETLLHLDFMYSLYTYVLNIFIIWGDVAIVKFYIFYTFEFYIYTVGLLLYLAMSNVIIMITVITAEISNCKYGVFLCGTCLERMHVNY